ncbi:hypothetical protein Mgra_00002999 [Meloidogyne graminicola]|uniref:Trimethylguanosine synthase n=1 Tax=Meloidogyne graminicola TaxID=189291 RepID=A0A8S9ZW42_9BILA|nr:hypothetical protein Mgra_00002999 [Meloidogyne graminicola]
MYENSSYYSSQSVNTSEAKTFQDYEFDWSVLLDATLEFFNPELKKKSHIHCVFSRVYIDDMELVLQGDNSETETESKEDFIEEQIKEVSIKKEEEDVKNEKIKNEQVINGLNNFDKKNNNKNEKRQKYCHDFEEKVKNLGYWTGFDLTGSKYKKNGGSESGRGKRTNLSDKSSKFGAGILDYASFWHDQEIKKQPAFGSGKRKKCKKATISSLSATSLHISTANSQIESNNSLIDYSEDNLSLNISLDKLNFEDKINFDFGFNPKRDKKLVAKNAHNYFSDDQEMMKYWYQRYRFFSKLDEGILLDREAWFSVTPEMLGQHVADRLVRIKNCVILDAFAGSGGNSIQFALKGSFVYGIDIDPIKLRCSARNAHIYGVRGRINFICGDFFNICKSFIGARKYKEENKIVKSKLHLKKLFLEKIEQLIKNTKQLFVFFRSYPYTTDLYPFAIDAVYLSPPWGGPSYAKSGKEEFDIQKDIVLDGVKIFNYARKISQNIVYFLPRNTSVDQLIALAASDGEVELEQSMLCDRVKALHAYYGKLVAHD